jgi:hypothetical protein
MVVIDTPPHTQPIINAALVRALRLPCVLVLNKTPSPSCCDNT